MNSDNAVIGDTMLEEQLAERKKELAALRSELAALKRSEAPAAGPMHDIGDEEATSSTAASQYPGNCYKDYCPCEAPQEGMDTLLCDQLEEGLEVDVQLMIAGRGFKEARRQAAEFGY